MTFRSIEVMWSMTEQSVKVVAILAGRLSLSVGLRMSWWKIWVYLVWFRVRRVDWMGRRNTSNSCIGVIDCRVDVSSFGRLWARSLRLSWPSWTLLGLLRFALLLLHL